MSAFVLWPLTLILKKLGKGSFAYFTEINETSLDVFSDYQYQGE